MGTGRPLDRVHRFRHRRLARSETLPGPLWTTVLESRLTSCLLLAERGADHQELADVLQRQKPNRLVLIHDLEAGSLGFSQPSNGCGKRAVGLDARDLRPGVIHDWRITAAAGQSGEQVGPGQ